LASPVKAALQRLRQLAGFALAAAPFLWLPAIADAKYSSPEGMALDPAGNLWLAEAGAN
jgi:hypothetical protein